MTTVLDKALKRQITVDDAEYTVTINPEGLRLTGKGKRNAAVTLRWADLLSGEAAMAVALNASLGAYSAAGKLEGAQPTHDSTKVSSKRLPR